MEKDESLLALGVEGLTAGVALIFVTLILRMVFDFVQSRKLSANGMDGISVSERREFIASIIRKLVRIEDQVHELYVWHAPNADGEQNWKNTRMIGVLEDLTKTIQHNTDVISNLSRLVEVQQKK